MKIITMMKELRELQAAEKDQTTTKPETSQATTLQALLETKEVEYAKAQDEISKLQRELELKSKECSGPEEKHEDIKTLFEKNIAELNRTGDPKAAAVLSILNLHDDLKTLRGQISASKDPERTSELKNQLEEKQEELNLKTDVIERLFPNPNIKLRNNLEAKRQELQKQINELKEKNEPQSDLILKVTDQYNKLRHPEREKPSDGQMSATITELRQQLRANEEERSRDQAEIRSLQDQLNQTEAQCSGYEQNLKDLQNDLDTKVKELSSKSDTISSLALQISTLTQQLEDLKKQLRNTASESKIKELQKLIDEKTAELDRKTEELKARSAQPQRILQIIALQAEIEKLANVAENSTDYNKITALQDQMNYLIEGVQDEDNDNTKLMFQILAQQDEIARLKKQEESQTRAELKKIKDLEDDLEDIRNQIQEKTLLLDTSDLRIANLSSQIMELHKKIQPLEDEISDLKEAHSENLEELQKRLNLSKRQLQDSELRLKDADAKNFQSVMEITDLKAKLKQAQRQGSKADKRKVNELEAKIQTQQKENRKLENTNKDLMQEVLELKKCCSVDTKCDDLQRQLQQSQIDADRLQQQLTDKDANLKQLQEQLENQIRENKKLQDDNKSLQAEKNKLEHDNQSKY
ncbi:uncharacterized protein LOC141804259 [Halichoeres trimaculatus]|uniref:uncharacterized protein LOC141804259 n=1 Tax=Halichoeres trimaculatus TaxID=147232 RepID=UPI003D9DFC3A